MNHERKEQHIKQLAFSIQQGASSYITEEFTIECPTPQRSGTSTQQRTYALMKARELMDALPRQETN